MLRVEIDTGGTATSQPAEIARLLRLTAANIEHTTEDGGRLFDVNGNPAGRWKYSGGRDAALRLNGCEPSVRPGEAT